MVLRIPLGDGWRVEGREPPDHHRSRWYRDDFRTFPATLRQYEFWGNPYALVAIEATALRRGAALDDLERKLTCLEQRLAALTSVGLAQQPGEMP